MRNKLSQRGNSTRQRVYDFIVEYIKKNGYAPTVREIGEAVSLKSTSSVFNHLISLEDEGKIAMKDKVPRAIKLVGYEFVKVVER